MEMDKEYLQYRAADIISQMLPRRFAYWIGLRVADWFYRHDHDGRANVISNLRHIFEFKGFRPSSDSLERSARKTFQYFGKYVVDFFRFARLSKAAVERMISLQHPEHIDQAWRVGRGVLVISAHFGSWEIGGAALSGLGYPISGVTLMQQNQKTNALFTRRRERRGIKIIPFGSAVRGTLGALKNKEFVATLADRDYSRRDDTISFFGAPANLPRGPAKMCLTSGAPILPGFLLRNDDDSYLMRFHPPIFPRVGMRFQDVQQRIRDVLEQEIGANPGQWFMFEEFWK